MNMMSFLGWDWLMSFGLETYEHDEFSGVGLADEFWLGNL